MHVYVKCLVYMFQCGVCVWVFMCVSVSLCASECVCMCVF